MFCPNATANSPGRDDKKVSLAMSDTIPQEPPQFKQCNKCLQDKPATAEFFYRANDRKGGLRHACIACENPNRKPKKDPIPEGMRLCTGPCQQLLPATLEFFHKKGKGLFAICKVCNNAKGKFYYTNNAESKKLYAQRNGDKIKERMKLYNQKNKEAIAERHHQSYIANKPYRSAKAKIYRQEHKEEIRKSKAVYYKTDRGKMVARASNHRHGMRKRAIPGMLTPEQIQTKMKAQRCRCYYCFNKFKKIKGQYVYHLEHTIPVSRLDASPRHDENFVVLACPVCNIKKGAKLPSEWSEGGRLF